MAKKEVFLWLKQGKKTVDIRKGNPQRGDSIMFMCGPHRLVVKVVGTQTGRLVDLICQDNFLQVIPSAASVDDAVGYLRGLYGAYDGVFTAYTVVV